MSGSRQAKAIEAVLAAVKEHPGLRAVLLKGSIARGVSDEFSDVDFYCVVDPAHMDDFLAQRLKFLQSYRPLIFHCEENFVGPQMVGVFDDALHFDLYTVTIDSLRRTDAISVLHDPEELLAQYRTEPLTLSPAEVAECYDAIAFLLLEIETSIGRGDYVHAARLGSQAIQRLGMILRYIFEPQRAQLGLKGLSDLLPPKLAARLGRASACLGTQLEAASLPLIVTITHETLSALPEEITSKISRRFLDFMTLRVASRMPEITGPTLVSAPREPQPDR